MDYRKVKLSELKTVRQCLDMVQSIEANLLRNYDCINPRIEYYKLKPAAENLINQIRCRENRLFAKEFPEIVAMEKAEDEELEKRWKNG